ncbi:unnamed protein product (macronuclear) [Paramecium tetraurelia]|uniref:Uncharacterized protein n=1 Tax=Paramecium tetraurelia TaxID=5888 RepID=A0E855_PARTE|nr:uncharacterized protein GSPATT00024200001 [Paramecium tetraurelia]CAK91472.1 unnamed protein product [Paramecium tetraurelia]|eukprot:XP_001458869.1 hypothetical protein (macronuclear) [Paramecium tetraurelia strain d4-2]
MPLKNFIDLTDGVISLIPCIATESRLDINIIIGMICRLTIFTLLILFKDIKQYSIGEVVAWIIAGLVQHLYILLIEWQYTKLGICTTLRREIQYKIMDSLQLLVGIIFLVLNLKSSLEILVLVLFSINFILNLIVIIYKRKIKEGYTMDYIKKGGNYQLYFGFLFGAVGIIIVVLYYGPLFLEQVDSESFYRFAWILSFVGQSTVIVLSFSYFCRNCSRFSWSYDWAKGILHFFYGIKVGIFSIIYGLITGFVLLGWFIWGFGFKPRCDRHRKRKQESEQIATA